MMQDLQHSFPSQERNEAVFVFARPFWLAFLPTILIFMFIFGLTAAAQAAVAFGGFNVTVDIADLIILILGGFELLTLVIFLVTILDFYFDIIVVTDRRLADIDQDQLFYRKVSELNLLDIEDTSFERVGFFQTVFDFGTVRVQTAGETNNFTIVNLRYPSQISAIISDLADQAKSGTPADQRFPETDVVGVINNQIITDPEGLVVAEALLPDDVRRNYTPRAPRNP